MSEKATETIQVEAIRLHKKTGMPIGRAESKAENTYVGKIAVKLGMLFLVFSGALVSYIIVTRDVTWLTVGMVLLFAGIGLTLLGLGFSLISRDAAPIVAGVGEFLKDVLLKVLRLKKNGGPHAAF